MKEKSLKISQGFLGWSISLNGEKKYFERIVGKLCCDCEEGKRFLLSVRENFTVDRCVRTAKHFLIGGRSFVHKIIHLPVLRSQQRIETQQERNMLFSRGASPTFFHP